MKMEERGWVTTASLEQWDLLRIELVKALSAANAVPKEVTSFLLAAEEIFVNIVQHAYKWVVASTEPTICTQMRIEHQNAHAIKVSIAFVDRGIPFNPLEYQSKPKNTRQSFAAPGGWGITIAREKTDKMLYSREDGSNHFTLIKTISIEERKLS